MAQAHMAPDHGSSGAIADAPANGVVVGPKCCCGREECVYLRHNCTILDSVERDLHTAAKMGQTLLARHEAYMASAECDRKELTRRIAKLEMDNAGLAEARKAVGEENQHLRDALEDLNETIKNADVKIDYLEANLRESQIEIRRLESTANRAATMARQISMLEDDQAVLQGSLTSSKEDARTAMRRLNEARLEINYLQGQLESMETEALKERERHLDAITRVERQRVAEKDIDMTAGRLWAVSTAPAPGREGGTALSSFIRELMQENSVLLLDRAELRGLLENSNNEIQMLREHLMYHQPAPDGDCTATATLKTELEQQEPGDEGSPTVSQELHIHHHYHLAHNVETKKARKKNFGITAPHLPSTDAAAPSTPARASWLSLRASPASATVHHSARDSVSTVPSNPRWSVFSENSTDFASSSAPSSPRSTPRDAMLVRAKRDMALPTWPIPGVVPTSPPSRATHDKHPSDLSARSVLMTMQPANVSARPSRSTYAPLPRPLRRTASHESIISLSNRLDMHSLTSRPSQLSLRPLGISAAGTNLSAVTARPTISRGSADGKRGSTVLRHNLDRGSSLPPTGSCHRNRVSSTPVPGTCSGPSPRQSSGALGKLAAWRPWGGGNNTLPSSEPRPTLTTRSTASIITPTISVSAAAAPVPVPAPSRSESTGLTAMPSIAMSDALAVPTMHPRKAPSADPAALAFGSFRASGINQPGSIPGFDEYFAKNKRLKLPSKLLPDNIGEVQQAMREVLEDN